jgi:coenzyme F420-0:L-glutamate ligase/coenzyme F420-1:gamma-L-glutamate ligase
MVPASRLELIALPGIPPIAPGDDLVELTDAALENSHLQLEDGDVLVYAQKIISKAEGRQVNLATVHPSARALALGTETGKDPRLIELILQESVRIVRVAKDVLIVEHQRGYIMANAGIDQSNVADPTGGSFALLLPEDADGSAEGLRDGLQRRHRRELGIIISDSFGRPWRVGTVGVAIGCAGLGATQDLRGSADLFGRALRVTIVGHADEIASAASLLMGQGREGRPIVLVRGLAHSGPVKPASALLRPAGEDLFR